MNSPAENVKPPPQWPALRPDLRPIDDLRPDEKNARTHSSSQIAQLAASLLRFGWTNPVLIDEDSSVLAGHGRLLGAARLVEEGHEEYWQAPVISAVGWTEEEKRAYIIADNRLAEQAGWDKDILRAELEALSAADFDMKAVGFSKAEIRALFAGARGGLTDPDAVPDVPEEEPFTRRGDIWQLGPHRIMCGDSTCSEDVEALLDGLQPHLMVTDPPYGVNYDPSWRADALGGAKVRQSGKVLNDHRADWTDAWALFPGDVAYVWHGALHAGAVQASLERCGFDMRAQIIWSKDRLVLSRGHYHWQHEPCWYAVRKGGSANWRGGRKRTTVLKDVKFATPDQQVLVAELFEEFGIDSTVWEIPLTVDDGATGHGTQKPVECMQRPMVCHTEPGDHVYEPFSGSGSTLIAAEACDRVCLAMELSPAYVDVAVQRWCNFTGKEANVYRDGVAVKTNISASEGRRRMMQEPAPEAPFD
ncbi:MAG: DNA methylase [Flavobacteriaceae bacterium]|jgi:DNA modification methylase|nr:DNA methylase [Flavobacteriaceae bacterium]|tara:strand:+ start:430 stop:1854 length:1425 start_codon:yes stop_codon:yes gene_type:complete